MFTKTNEIEGNFNYYLTKIDEINSILESKKTETENFADPIKKIGENFKKKTEDFYREDRKLRIAVIGQVKAGKSSFLNTLLFDGKDVLPKAATPKTANLTVIKYGETNFLEIEFYTEKEWHELVKLSKIQGDTLSDEVKVAKEIMEMAKKRNLDLAKYIGKTDYKIEFDSYPELLGKLNDFAGENGEFTPIVKSIQMTINNENIKALEIVDTPGMNDPIVSRTDKTRQFIEYCDVVFFLSRTPKFIDKTDMELLTRQLPQKGVSKMYLIGSQYDSVINDSIWEKGSFEKADTDSRKRLFERAKNEFDNLISKMSERGIESSIINVIANCKNPILISSMAHNMSKKEHAYYSEEELTVYNGINEYKPVTKEMLIELGNFKSVNTVFEEVIANKDETLAIKAKNFIPASSTEVKNELEIVKTKIEKRINLLSQNDIEKLKESKKETLSKKHNIQADVENVFGGLTVKLDKTRTELFSDLRKTIQNYSRITEKTGTEEKTGYREVSSSKWYKPWTWGDTTLESYTYNSTYTYLDINDAVESLRNYANEAVSQIENSINQAIELNKAKRELLNVVVNNFDTTDENFDPAYFRLLVEKTLNTIEMPVVKIDIKSDIQKISANFSGEVREGDQKIAMQMALSDSLHSVFSSIESVLLKEFSNLKSELNKLKDSLADQLLGDITGELEIIESQFANRKKELERNESLLQSIGKCIQIMATF